MIGTLPDSARSFHAKGGLVLELPGPGVIFGIDAARVAGCPSEIQASSMIGCHPSRWSVSPATATCWAAHACHTAAAHARTAALPAGMLDARGLDD